LVVIEQENRGESRGKQNEQGMFTKNVVDQKMIYTHTHTHKYRYTHTTHTHASPKNRGVLGITQISDMVCDFLSVTGLTVPVDESSRLNMNGPFTKPK